MRAGERRSRKEVNWEKIVAFVWGYERRRNLRRERRASIFAEEREERRRRVNWVSGVRAGGSEEVGSFRVNVGGR